MRGVIAGVAISIALVLVVAFGVDAQAVIADPALVIAPFALVLCCAMLSTPLMRSDIQHRSDAVIDQLTGLLNRKALSTRLPELIQQSQITGEPVGIIVGDLDHFKSVNDTRGHAVGDAVLKDVAYLLRKQLRAFDLAYRLGGEEFLILLPGSDLGRSAELAERLHEGVSADRVAARARHDELRRRRAPSEARHSTTRPCSRRPTRRFIKPSRTAATRSAWPSPIGYRRSSELGPTVSRVAWRRPASICVQAARRQVTVWTGGAELVAMEPDRSLSEETKASSSSWLCRDGFDRERMLDMDERVRPARQRAFAILGLSLVVLGPWVGWWPLLFLLPAALFFAAADRLKSRVARPEYPMFAAFVACQLTIAGAVALAGGTHAPGISWLAIAPIVLSSRFSMRGVIAGVPDHIALVLAVALGVDAHEVFREPGLVVVPFALVICVAVLSTPLMQSDIQHRSDAVIDPLTGLLNRKALEVRVNELVQQSEVTSEPVGLIVSDLDSFKTVNDTRGHAVGDAVLKDVAYLLRKQLRAFDLAYRIGGEEFLILLPGSDLALAG